MVVDVIQIRNRAAFDVPDIRALFERAFAGGKPVEAAVAMEEFAGMIDEPFLCVLLGTEDGEFKGLSVLMDRDTRLFLGVTIYHFFNEGGDDLRDALVHASIAFSRFRGYDKIWTVNATGRSDKAWKRMFANHLKTRKLGTIIEVDIGEGTS